MMFLDQAKIHLKSGWGGDGCVSFRREKFLEFGGPDGGHGGNGGSIYFKAVPGLNTLIDFRYTQHLKAERGRNGEGSKRNGAKGKDLWISVPVGTQILADDEERTLLADLTEPGQEILLLRGGEGGRGNTHFKSSTNRAPRQFQKGSPGQEISVWLRLKLLADVGLVGCPNAGKSSLLNAISNAQAKVGDYIFTTLKPQLGVVRHKDHEWVTADIPGLIAGAAEGIGIGDRFLGHIERCRLLIHLVDASGESPTTAWRTVQEELESYGAGLSDKRQILVLNKCDAATPQQLANARRHLTRLSGTAPIEISAISGAGLEQLLDKVLEEITSASDEADIAVDETTWSPI